MVVLKLHTHKHQIEKKNSNKIHYSTHQIEKERFVYSAL